MDGQTKQKRVLNEADTVIRNVRAKQQISINFNGIEKSQRKNVFNDKIRSTAMVCISTPDNSDSGLICLDSKGLFPDGDGEFGNLARRSGICMTNHDAPKASTAEHPENWEKSEIIFTSLSTGSQFDMNFAYANGVMPIYGPTYRRFFRAEYDMNHAKMITTLGTQNIPGIFYSYNKMQILPASGTNNAYTPGKALTVDGDIDITGDYYKDGSLFTGGGGGGGSSTFLALTDTPSSFTASKFFAVNSSGNAIELVDFSYDEGNIEITGDLNIDGNIQCGGDIDISGDYYKDGEPIGGGGGGGGGGGSSTFLALTDTPSEFNESKFLAVNSSGNAVEFVDVESVWNVHENENNGSQNFIYDSNTPDDNFIGIGTDNPVTPLHCVTSYDWNQFNPDGNFFVATFENEHNEAIIQLKSNPSSGNGAHLEIGHHAENGSTSEGIAYFNLFQGNSKWYALKFDRTSSQGDGDIIFGANGHSASITINGDIDYTGDINDVSDGRFKKNQQEVSYQDCYDKIKQIKLKKYDWDIEKLQIEVNKTDDPRYPPSPIVMRRQNNELGFIAQELENVIPDVVKTKEKFNVPDFKSVNYNKINLYLFGAVRQLINQNETMQIRIEELEKLMG